MAGNGARIVDADGHVLEPPTGMAERAPARFRDRIWQIVVRADGSEWLRYNGHERPTGGMALAGAGGMSPEDRDRARRGEIRYSDIRSGAFEPLPRLRDMDLDHIGQSVLYPTMLLGLPSLTDHEFAEVQADAYNDWLADYCAAAPTRLFAVGVVPQQDVERAVRVIRRARERGHVAVFLRPNPSLDGKKFNDPAYDPIWAVCQELDLPLGFHPFLAPDMPGACRALGYYRLKAEGTDFDRADEASPIRHMANVFFSQAISNPFDMMETLTLLTCGGVLERFPRLKVILLEANGGWIVPWLERLDHHYEVFRFDVPWMKMKPSEYFRRQCWISFDPDESTLAFTARSPLVGADRIIWASDYPHPDAKIPGVVDELREATATLSDAERARILGLNAAELYGLPAGP
ncbi:MAG TPA: amidohydrolase family protein [Candidatus Binatia bacterium]|nr:amidohydrolase family protein [Candidatus Binatia bacterium]